MAALLVTKAAPVRNSRNRGCVQVFANCAKEKIRTEEGKVIAQRCPACHLLFDPIGDPLPRDHDDE
jgi:hypothetical protein